MIMKRYIATIILGVLLATPSSVMAQGQQTLKGRVVDADGKPIAGAVVNVAEQNRIVLTDKDGNFTLKKVSGSDEICVSSVGYKNTQVKVDLNGLQVTLEADEDKYSKTTPVPFGRKELRLTTESKSVVTGEELQKHPVTILQNAFTSTVNGMETYEVSSEPGWSETAMYIRGVRTMNANARSPLVIVDNVERDMSFLDAFPIENITILKDAASTAIYGMRGANGAIVVTTKRGEAGKTHIDFTQEIGFNKLSNYYDAQNSYNQALTQNRVKYLDGSEPIYTAEDIEKYRRVSNGETLEGNDRYKYFNTNWFEELYRTTAPTYRTNLQISGGNQTARYYVSFSYLRQEGMWNTKGTEYNDDYSTQHVLNRWNLRSNIDINVNKYLNVSLDLGGRIDNINQPNYSVFSIVTFGAVEADPMKPVYNPNGTIFSTQDTGQGANPIRLLGSAGLGKNKRRNLYSTVNLTGNLDDLVPGLKANALVSFDAYETFTTEQSNTINAYYYDYWGVTDETDIENMEYQRSFTYSAMSNPAGRQRAYTYNLNFNAGLSYNRTFGKHGIDARAFFRTYRNELAGDDYGTQQSQSSNRYISWNGQLTYNFDRRYVLSGNFSRMGCDNFAPDNRWDNFWGVGAAWVASEENFLRKLGGFDLLKFRASYGRAGQAQTGSGRYPYQNTYAAGTGSHWGYGFGYNATGVSGFVESLAGNSNNIWEISRMLNVGADFDFVGGKLYGSFDWFKEWRSQILVDRSTVPSMLGVAMAQDSYGKAESRGFEAVIGHRNKIGDFKYYAEMQLTYNKNKITEMDETEPDVEWQRKTGRPIRDYATAATIYEWENRTVIGGWNIYRFMQWASDPDKIATSQQDAIDNPEKYPYNSFSGGNQPLGTAVFQDVNGDRMIDDKDRLPITYTLIPEFIPTFRVGFEWKGFDARAIVNAYLHRSVFLERSVAWSGYANHGMHEVVNTWGYYTDDPTDPRNVNAKYPRPTWGGWTTVDSNRDTSTDQNDIWIVNGDFWSLRNIEVGYSLPKSLISKVSMTKCRVYFSAYNLANWSHLPKGLDPEKPMSYCWWYPKTKTFTFGLNIGF